MSDADQLFTEGYRYYTEAGDENELRRAFELLSQAAGMGHALAQDVLGNMYEDGDGAPLDIKTAAELYRMSAEQDCPPGLYDYGMLFLDGHGVSQDKERAFALISKAVSIGNDPEHMFTLSVLYLKGEGVERDEKRSLELLRKAEKLGSVDAKANLGAMYLSGEGLPKDEKRAFGLLKEAAEDQDCSAMCNLALMYEQGIVVEKDMRTAISYYKQAADLGYPPAFYHLGVLVGEGEADLGDIDPVGLLETAGSDGNIDALYRLGVMYYDGDGVEQDFDMASQYFRAGAEFENPECMYNLGIMIIRGEAEPSYEEEEYDMIITAADAGYGPAKELLEKSGEE